VLLFVNGLILLGAEVLRRSAALRKQAGAPAAAGRPVRSFHRCPPPCVARSSGNREPSQEPSR
jgi:hypothetical protein